MRPDINTYEAWLLDRAEGTLSPEREALLAAFLAEHPHLEPGTDPLPVTHAPGIGFPNKADLYRTPDKESDAERMIAYWEGDLVPEERSRLESDAAHDTALAKELARYGRARISAAHVALDADAKAYRHFPPSGPLDAHRLLDHLIARAEGDLSPEQCAAVERYLEQHPEHARAVALVDAARVRPTALVYPGKAGLYRKRGRMIPLWRPLSAAASIILLLFAAQTMLRTGGDTTLPPSPTTTAAVPPATTTIPAPAPAVPATLPQEEPPVQQGSTIRTRERADTPRTPLPTPPPGPAPSQLPELMAMDTPSAPEPGTTELAEAVAPSGNHLQQHEEPTTTTADGTTLAALVANTVRREVLTTRERFDPLDATDAVALADKGLHSISGGHGGLAVERTEDRRRVQLRLGRHLSITASTAR